MVADYINYFRQLAVQHKDLQHNPESETGDGPALSCRFTRINTDMVLRQLRSGIGFPCMTLELYETDTHGQTIAWIGQSPRGALMIVDKPERDTELSIQACFEKTERILFDVLKQIWNDMNYQNSSCPAPFREFGFTDLEIIPVGPIFSGQYGYRLTFSFEHKNPYDITQPPAPGTFVNP